MTPEEFARVEASFEELSDLREDEQARRLAALAQEDPGVAKAVEAMLAEEEGGDALLERPVVGEGLTLEHLVASGDSLPAQVGPFKILARLGSGGMGTVYLAEQDEPARQVAVKVLHGWLATPKHRRRFRREARLLARLRHPGITQVYEFGLHGGDEGQPYLAMELVEGLSLTEFARTKGLDLDGRVALVARLADAVHHAHGHGVIHRDLKPDNVLVVEGAGAEEAPLPKVLDFGIACAADVEENLATFQTTEGQVLGTLAFMSPEQAASGHVDLRTDVYSLGAILFLLLSGRLPHELAGRSLPDALHEIQEGDPTRLGQLDTRLRGDLDTIAARALEPDPALRYGTAAELAQDLRRFLAHKPILARAPSTLYHLRKFARRNRTLVGGVVSTLVVLIVGIIVSVTFAVRSARNAERAERDGKLARMTTYRASLDAALATTAMDPGAARQHLAAAPEELRGWEWDYLHRSLDRAVLALPFGADALQPPIQDTAMGADGVGCWAYATQDPPGVKVLELREAGSRIHLPTAGAVTRLALSREGALLAAVVEDGPRLHLWDLTHLEPTERHVGLDLVPTSLQFSFDDATLALGDETGAVRLFGAQSLDVRLALPVPAGVRKRNLGSPILAAAPLDASVFYGLNNHLNRYDAQGRGLFTAEEARGEEDSLWRGPFGCADSSAFAVSPDGASIVRSCKRNYVVLHATDTLRIERLLEWRGEKACDLSFEAEGRQLAGGGPSGIFVWDLGDGRVRKRLDVPARRIALGPDGLELALATPTGAELWSLSDATSTVLEGLDRLALTTAFSPDGSLVAAAGRGPRIGLWDVGTGELLETYSVRQHEDEFEQECLALSFDAQGLRLLVAHKNVGPDGMAYHLSSLGLLGGRQVARAGGKEGERRGIIYLEHPFWRRALPGSRASRMKRYEGVALGPLGRRWARADDEVLIVRDAENGDVVHELRTSPSAELDYRQAGSVTFHPDATQLAWGHADGSLELWPLSDGAQPLRVETGAGPIHALDFHPAGTRLAVGGADGLVRILRTEDLAELLVLRGHSDSVLSVRFSPDGIHLLAASADSDLRLWDTRPSLERRRDIVRARSARERMRPRVVRLLAELGSREAVVQHLENASGFGAEDRTLALHCLLRSGD